MKPVVVVVVVVKLLTDDDGAKYTNTYWHHIDQTAGSDCLLCTGEVFGFGEGSATYKLKNGNITCPDCIAIIENIKKVKNYVKANH